MQIIAVPVISNEGNPVYLAVQLVEEDVAQLKAHGVHVVELRPDDKGMVLASVLGAVFATLPDGVTIVGAATLGVIGGAAAVIGTKIGDWMWPDKDKKDREGN